MTRWIFYVDNIIVNGGETLPWSHLFGFSFGRTLLIPKQTYDKILTLFQNSCGTQTIDIYYILKCSNTTLDTLNSLKIGFKIENLSLTLADLFRTVDDGYILSKFLSYPTIDGTQGKTYNFRYTDLEP